MQSILKKPKRTLSFDSVLLILVMVVMPVVVVMMSVSALCVVDGAVVLVAMLAGGFKLKGCVDNTVLGEFFADGVLDVVRVSLGNHVEGCIVVVPVHTPNVDVMHILHTLDVAQMLTDFVHVDAVGCLFEKEINGFFEGADGVDEDKHRHTDGHQRVDDRNIGKTLTYADLQDIFTLD